MKLFDVSGDAAVFGSILLLLGLFFGGLIVGLKGWGK